MEKTIINSKPCKQKIAAIADAMYVLGGKWKMHIIAALYFGEKRNSELLREIEGISGKMLSRELKEMEMNHLVNRKIVDDRPVKVTYELTKYSQELLPVIDKLASWGIEHRKVVAE